MNTREKSHDFYMKKALELAKRAFEVGDVPVGAVVVAGDEVIGEAHNETVKSNDPTAHAEILAIRRAAERLGNYRLTDTVLYTSLEPCAMCAGAVVWARIARVIIALRDPKAGAAGSILKVIPNALLNHRPAVEFGVRQDESRQLLQRFFTARR